jgi:hypothetical protein
LGRGLLGHDRWGRWQRWWVWREGWLSRWKGLLDLGYTCR